MIKIGLAQASMILAVLACAGCAKTGHTTGEQDIYLKCTGSIGVIGSNSYTAENQEIAAHIKGSKISFSGNDLLGGENIPVCTTHPGGTAQDGAYYRFDSDSCESNQKGDNRTYGTYYWVLSKLDLSHTTSGPVTYIAQGRFKCQPVERN